MTSRDFGFTTLRSAVAYRRNNTLVPPNNVYVTSTNGAAVFSDTLTISTINVSTINGGGGGGGGVNSVTAGTNIAISGSASNPVVNVDINSTLNMNGYGIINCNLMNNTIANGNITISAIEELNMSSNDLLTLSSNVINVTATGDNINLRAGKGISMFSADGSDISLNSDAAINLLAPDGNITISTGSGPGRYVTIDTGLLTLSSIGDINMIAGEDVNVTVGSTGKITATGTALLSAVAGGSSGNYLSITINGTPYKIALLTALNNGWATRLTGAGDYDFARGITVDSKNNIIVTGTYGVQGPAAYPLTIYNVDGSIFETLPNTNQVDTYIIKYDSNGFGIWATRISGTNVDFVTGIIVDSNDNIIVTGYYAGLNTTIYNASGTIFGTLPASTGGYDVYIVKYNSDGFGIWSARMAGTVTGDEAGLGITVDSSNSIIVTGIYSSNPVTIYNKDGTTFGTLSLGGTFDTFLVKYDSSGFGIWATKIVGAGTQYGYGIAVGSNNSIIVTGYYDSNPVSFYNADGSTYVALDLINSGSNDAFIVKYGSNGFGVWSTRVAGAGIEKGLGITVDSNNNIIVSGVYTSNPVTIYDAAPNVSTRTLVNSGGYDVFIVKYNSSGVSQWATRIAGAGYEFSDVGSFGYVITVDSNNNIIVTGSYNSNPVTIWNASGFSTLPQLDNSGAFDSFIVKYDSSGTGIWATRIAGTALENGSNITVDSNNNIIVTGTYSSNPVTIYNTPGGITDIATTLPNTTANADIYIVKYTANGYAN